MHKEGFEQNNNLDTKIRNVLSKNQEAIKHYEHNLKFTPSIQYVEETLSYF